MYIDRIRINWDKVSADSYLTRIPAICLLQELAFRKPVTFFVGENGTGKSTLLEAIAIAYGFNPEARSNEAKAFGRGAVLLGSQGSGDIKMSREHQSPHYTTLWSDIPKTTVR